MERTVAVIPVPQLLPQLLASTATNETLLPGKESLLLVGAVDYSCAPGASGEDRGGVTRVTLDEIEPNTALPKSGLQTETRAEIDQLQRSFKVTLGTSHLTGRVETGVSSDQARKTDCHSVARTGLQ